MLPVLVRAIQERSAGPKALRDFLCAARQKLESDIQITARRRKVVTHRSRSRRERMQVGRYYDLDRRSQQALRLALEALQSYLDEGDEKQLDQALRQYDTSERFQRSQLRARMDLTPLVCERISRAC
jgi:phage tail tube protein FII